MAARTCGVTSNHFVLVATTARQDEANDQGDRGLQSLESQTDKTVGWLGDRNRDMETITNWSKAWQDVRPSQLISRL